MDGKEYEIPIIIYSEETEQSARNLNPQQRQARNVKTLKSGNSVVRVAILHLGKNALQYGTSNYGNLTGDYLGQAKFDNAAQTLTYVTALSAGVAGVIYDVGDIAIKAATRAINVQKANQNAQQLRTRISGVTNNGGR